jgi:V-type H+-transporting ATPase 21kDa proteolipid subunit
MDDPIFWATLGVSLSVFLSVIGAALGISIAAPAIAGAGTERPEIVSKSLIATILAEALAIYGLVVGLLAIFKLPNIAATNIDSGFRLFFGGTIMGIAAIAAGIGIGTSGGAMASATAEKPELFSRTVVPLILAEALAIYAFVAALLLVLQA